MRTWTVASAKAKFNELIRRATNEGPQTIAEKGRALAVVVSEEEWKRKTTRRGSLAEFFASSPLRDSGVKVERLRGKARKVEL